MKNKKALIIATIAIILMAGVILGILYFTTDLFKTEQQLFYKYIAQTNVLSSDFITQYNVANDRIAKNSNSSSANIDVSMNIPNQETGSVDVQEVLSVASNGLEDMLLKQSYRDFTFSSNGQNFLTLKYMRDDNTYAIGADNILTKYLAVENANLKDFAYKLGIKDVSQIPDSIPTNYEEILRIEEQTLTYLKQTYGTLIYNNISEENFYRIKNSDKTETIGVSLTEQELINLLKIILETVKNDNTLLNLIVTKAQQLNYTNITVENIQLEIQNILDKSAENTYSTDKDFIKISIIKKDKNVIKLQIENKQELSIYEKQESIENNTASEITPESFKADVQWKNINSKYGIDIDFSELNRIILSIKENDTEIAKTTFDYSYNNNNINLNVEVQSIEDEKTSVIKTQYQINNYQADNIIQNLVINMSSGTEENYQMNLVNNITLKQDVQISKLTTENSAKLNDMTSEELSQLFTALENRINQLYGENLNLGSVIIHQEDATTSTGNITDNMEDLNVSAFNSKFAEYEGTISSINLRELVELVIELNSNSSKQIKINNINTIDGLKKYFEEIDLSQTYDTTFEYSDTGFLDNIVIEFSKKLVGNSY